MSRWARVAGSLLSRKRGGFRKMAGVLVLVAGAATSLSGRQATPSHAQGPDLGTWIFGPIELQLAATGGAGTGPYAWSVVEGTLPPGISLRTDVPSWFSSSANAGLIGVATTGGTYNFRLRVSRDGQFADRNYTWRLSRLTVAEPRAPDAFLGKPYSFQFSALNAAGPVTFSPTSISPGWSLSASGLLTGTPTTPSFVSVGFSVFDGVDRTFHSRSIFVSTVEITSDARLPNAKLGQPYSATIAASGGAGGYSFTNCFNSSAACTQTTGLPNGLQLDASGHITGTPTSSGKSTFTVTAIDANNVSYTKPMSISVVGHPETLPSLSPYFTDFSDSCTIGNLCEHPFAVTGGAGGPYTWSAIGLPPGMSMKDGVPWWSVEDGIMTGVPSAAGSFEVKVVVSDKDGNTVTNTFPVHVSPLQLRDHLTSGALNQPYSHYVRVIGGQVPASAPFYSQAIIAGRLPEGLSFNPSTGMVSGTPLEASRFSFDPRFQFADAGGNTLRDRSYFVITNPLPTTIAFNSSFDLGTRSLNTFQSVPLSACCAPAIAWSQVGGGLPTGMSLSPDGVLSGTPTAAGTYVFILRAADAQNAANANVQAFKLTISSLAMSFAQFLEPYSNVGSPVSLQLSASGGAGPITWRVRDNDYLPPGLQFNPVTATLSGTFTESGQYSFSIEAVDAVGAVVSRFFSIPVYRFGDVPPLNLTGVSSITRSVGAQVFTLTTSGGRPPYSYSMTPGAPDIPGMRLQSGQPLPSFSTATGAYMGVLTESGSFSSSIRVIDSVGETFDRAFTINVQTLNQLSQTLLPRASVGEPYWFQFDGYGGTGNYTWTSTATLPAGLSFNDAGTLSGTPTGSGSFSIFATLIDLVTNQTQFVNYTLAINPFAITSPSVLPEAAVGMPYSFTLSAPNCGAGCTWTPTSFNGLVLAADGVLSGTPIGGSNSSWLSFTATATGANGTALKTFSLPVKTAAAPPLSITAPGNLTVLVGNTTATRLVAQGGTPPYAWSLESGSLPPGLELFDSGELVASLLVPGSGYIAGRAMQLGFYDFVLEVTDAMGATATAPYTWNVTPLSLQYTSLPVTGPLLNNPLIYDAAYAQQLLVIGGTGNYNFTHTTALPPGLTLSPSGVVSGIPSNTGSFTTSLVIQDDAGHSTPATLFANISGPTSTTLGFSSGPDLGTLQQGGGTFFNVTPTGGTGPYTVTPLSPLPPGFTLLSGDSLLIGMSGFFALATTLQPGPQSFTLMAQDAAGNIGVRTFSVVVAPYARLNVTAINDASVGTPYSHKLVSFGVPVSWSLSPNVVLPPGLSLAGDGTISGIPAAAGSYNFTVTARDASNVVSSYAYSIRVSQVGNSDPHVLPQTAIVGQPFTYQFHGSPGAAWFGSSVPAGLSLDGNGLLSGTPTTAGTFALTVNLSNGGVTFSRRVTLFVALPNPTVLDSNIASAALPDAALGQLVTTALDASGGRPPYSWSLTSGALPPGLELTPFRSELSSLFQPGATAITGMTTVPGSYAFELELTDSAGAKTRRTFTMKVSAMSITSVAPREPITGTPFAQQWTAAGGVPPYIFTISPASATQDTLPPGLTMTPGGLVSGVATSSGDYTFGLTATDAAGNSFTRVMTLAASSPSGARVTSANPPDTWVGRGRSPFLLTAVRGFNSPMTASWTLVGGTLPPGVGIVSTDGVTTELSGAPNTPGVYLFALRATDTTNPSIFADHTFTYRVAPMQVVSPPIEYLTVLDLPSGNVGVPYAFTLKAAGGSPPYAFVNPPTTPLPPGLTLSAAGVISGTPEATGAYTVAPVITDSSGETVNAVSMNLIVAANDVAAPLVRSGVVSLKDGSVGVPFLDNAVDYKVLFRGGRAPYTLAMADGTTLPPGEVLLPASNGLSPRIGGVPTTPGTFDFSLLVSDSSGQTLTIPVTQKISVLSMSPGALPPGMVGVPYSQTLVFSGGTAPYTVLLNGGGGGSDMPPGLSLNSAGLLAGTPTSPGNFRLNLRLADSAGQSVDVFHDLTIDNAGGQSPALHANPNPLQVLQTGSGAAAPVTIDVQSTSGNLPFNAAVTGIPGASLAGADGVTSSSVTLTVPALPAGIYHGIVAAQSTAAANLVTLVPVRLTSTPPPQCAFTLNPAGASIPSAGGSGSFKVETAADCAWTATVPPGSVLAVTNPKGTGPGTISYSMPANATAAGRTVNIGVADQFHTVTQFGTACAFALSPGRFAAPAGGGSASIGITASVNDDACAWTVTSGTLTALPSSGTWSDRSLTVNVPPNPNAAPRVLTANIGGRTLTVNQAGAACVVSLSPYTASARAEGDAGSVEVNTPVGCAYETTPGPSWLTVTSGASGTGSSRLEYSVQPSTTSIPRTGSLSIGGQTFTVTQDGLPCSVTVNTSGLPNPFNVTGGVGLIGVTANGPDCAWKVTGDLSWATISPPEGKGNGTIGVTVLSNAASADARTGQIGVAGQIINLAQAGTTCTFALQSPGGSAPAAGGGGTAGVIAPSACTWEAVSDSPSWLTVTAAAGRGSGDVRFAAAANPAPEPREGTLTIAGLTYTVTQAGAPCVYTFAFPGITIAASGASTVVSFSTAFPGCAPAPKSYSAWLHVDGTVFDGTNGDLQFSVDQNPSTVPRTGTIRLGEELFTVFQTGGTCGFSLDGHSARFAAPGGDGAINGSPSALGCEPAVSTDQPSFITLGGLTTPAVNIFRLNFSVAPFSSLTPALRFGKITFGGQIVSVKQTSY